MPTLNESEAAGGLLRATASLNYKNERSGERRSFYGGVFQEERFWRNSKEETVPGGGTEEL